MFKLSLRKYSAFLFVQIALLLFDLSVNTFSFLARGNKSHLISIYVAQDVCLLISFCALFYSLYSTYVYQAGLSELLYTKFRSVFCILVVYFLLCLLTQIAFYSLPWPKTITALYIIQRLLYANPCLWDKNDPNYDNNSTRINVFISIGKEINRSGSDVSKVWQALREKYIREKIKLNENTGRQWNSTRRWEFFDCLAFVHLGMDEQHQAIVGSLSVQVNDKSYFEEVFNATEKALVRPMILGNDDKSSVPRSQIKGGIKHSSGSSASVASVYIPTQEPRLRFKRETNDSLPETSFSSSRAEDKNEAMDPLDNTEPGSKRRKKVSPFYYYSCKRASLRVSDPRFYENLDWISEQMAIK
uniref:Transmembrane protein 138 n=1 Tax=Phlebotomus papatasi TaxID=29031 RepID=A0A1B0D1K2_PHLPP